MSILRRRRNRGSMLIFVVVSMFILVGLIAFFSLGYARLLGSNSEQRTAIEAAALAAARDLSRIVIETPEYGWISLSDSAPVGTATRADDNYYVPVKGINTIIGTNRLDYCIAEQVDDAWLKTIIQKDLEWACAAQTKLQAELNKAVTPGYIAKDINGAAVEVYKDAEEAYQKNGQRMTGGSKYTSGSLKLTLGGITGGAPTSLKTPAPASMAHVPSTSAANGFYLSYKNIPVGNVNYVFAGIGDGIKLIDAKKWVASVPGLPYQLQTVVRAEATQELDGHEIKGYKTTAVACAQPANVADPKPCPGAFTFSFPDGLIPEIQSPGAMLTYGNMKKAGYNCSYQYAESGDFPVDAGSAMRNLEYPYDASLPLNSSVVYRRAIFDWWKRAGTKLNISSAANMLDPSKLHFVNVSPAIVDWKSPAKVGEKYKYNLGKIPNGSIHIYKVKNNGVISYENKQLDPIEIPVAAENQLYSECINAVTGSSIGRLTVGPFMYPDTGDLFDEVYLEPAFDCYIRDYSYQPGGHWGGQHAGEPLKHPKTAWAIGKHGPFDTGSGAVGTKPPPPGFGGNPHPYSPQTRGHGRPPAITNQSDLAESAGYPQEFYQRFEEGAGAAVRPSYTRDGMVADVRFRRQVNTGTFSDVLGYKIGYVGEKYGDSVPSKTMLPYVPPLPADPGTGTGGTGGTDPGGSTGGSTGGATGGSTGGT